MNYTTSRNPCTTRTSLDEIRKLHFEINFLLKLLEIQAQISYYYRTKISHYYYKCLFDRHFIRTDGGWMPQIHAANLNRASCCTNETQCQPALRFKPRQRAFSMPQCSFNMPNVRATVQRVPAHKRFCTFCTLVSGLLRQARAVIRSWMLRWASIACVF